MPWRRSCWPATVSTASATTARQPILPARCRPTSVIRLQDASSFQDDSTISGPKPSRIQVGWPDGARTLRRVQLLRSSALSAWSTPSRFGAQRCRRRRLPGQARRGRGADSQRRAASSFGDNSACVQQQLCHAKASGASAASGFGFASRGGCGGGSACAQRVPQCILSRSTNESPPAGATIIDRPFWTAPAINCRVASHITVSCNPCLRLSA